MEIIGTKGAAGFALRQALRQPAALLTLLATTKPAPDRTSLTTPSPPAIMDLATASGKGNFFDRLV